jgi:hypothetical protein
LCRGCVSDESDLPAAIQSLIDLWRACGIPDFDDCQRIVTAAAHDGYNISLTAAASRH